MDTQLTISRPTAVTASRADLTAHLGALADEARRAATFTTYQAAQTHNTLRAQRADLASFAAFLTATGHADAPSAEELATDPSAWQGMTAGLIAAFKLWSNDHDHASTATTSRRLATVRKYAALATDAGSLTEDALAQIQRVRGFAAKAARQADERRQEAAQPTRISTKRAKWTNLDAGQRAALKQTAASESSPRGRRDALLINLLLDHGLRVGEAVSLTRNSFDLERGEMVFDRPKVGIEAQRHILTSDTLRALTLYLMNDDAPADANAPILRGSRKDHTLTEKALTENGAYEIVAKLGRRIGVTLSPHDLRHVWTTFHTDRAERGETSLLRVQEGGGWASLAMVRRYAARAAISNQGLAISL